MQLPQTARTRPTVLLDPPSNIRGTEFQQSVRRHRYTPSRYRPCKSAGVNRITLKADAANEATMPQRKRPRHKPVLTARVRATQTRSPARARPLLPVRSDTIQVGNSVSNHPKPPHNV